MQEILIYVLVIGAFLAFGWLFMSRGEENPDAEYGREAGWSNLPFIFKATWGLVTVFEDSIGAVFAEWMPGKAAKFADLAVIAALPLTGKRVLAASFALGLVGGLVGLVCGAMVYMAVPPEWFWTAPLVAVALFAMGWFWPSQNLARYAEERQTKLTRELPFAIDLIGGAMRSGLDFGAAVRYYVSLKMGGPLSEEFDRVLADTTLGKPFAESLGDMARRVKIESFTAFVGVVSYGMEIGASVAQSLKMHGTDLRRARFNIAERKAARAPAVMIIPLVLFIMPAVFIVVLTPLILRLKGAM